MRRGISCHQAVSVVLVCVCVLGPAAQAAGPASPTDAGATLVLDVVINGRAIGLLGTFQRRGDALLATRRELRALGLIPLAADAARGDDALENLNDLPGISFRLDERGQRLEVKAASSSLVPTEITAARGPPLPPPQSSTGAVVNYNVIGTRSEGFTQVQGLLDARLFSPVGVASSGAVLENVAPRSSENVATRLDSTYTYSDPDSLRRYHAGDLISGGLSWTRPVRLGGVQVSTDFGLRSDLVTFPVPTIAGQVAVPSSVDVLVNGVQMLSRDVQPGPFELRQLPVVNGAGTVSVAVTNAAGQQTVQTLPFYASNALLSRGLSSFSAEAGAVRLNYGLLSNDYQGGAGSASYRRGVADWLTMESHGEASSDTFMGGVGASIALGTIGVVSFAGAGGGARARGASPVAPAAAGSGGGLGSVSFERISHDLSLTGSLQMTTRGFRDLAASYGDPVPRLTGQAGVGLSLGSFGSLGMTFSLIRRDAVTDVNPALQGASGYGYAGGYGYATSGQQLYALVPATRVDLLSASYSREVFNNRASLYATGFSDLANRGSNGFLAGFSLPFGARDSVTAGATFGTQSYGSVQASRSAPEVGDAGWQVAGNSGQPSRLLADGQYRTPWALVDAGVDRFAGQNTYRGTAQGALVVADGHVFAANTIYDSFAIIDTEGAAGVHVLQENRPAGVTDSAGLKLLPDLRSYDSNRLAIDPRDVPLDASITDPERQVRPRDRSGVIVHIPVHKTQGALLTLADADGKPLPLGSEAVLESKAPAAGGAITVGYDGEAFATDLDRHNVLHVTTPDGKTCTVRFDFTAKPGALPKIGPLPCSLVGP